jgi:RES domain-containing protein
MIVYRLRHKPTNQFMLSIGGRGGARWNSKGKLYESARDLKIALTHLETRTRNNMTYDAKREIGWDVVNATHTQAIEEKVEKQMADLFAEIEVIEYNLEQSGKAVTLEEFRG